MFFNESGCLHAANHPHWKDDVITWVHPRQIYADTNVFHRWFAQRLVSFVVPPYHSVSYLLVQLFDVISICSTCLLSQLKKLESHNSAFQNYHYLLGQTRRDAPGLSDAVRDAEELLVGITLQDTCNNTSIWLIYHASHIHDRVFFEAPQRVNNLIYIKHASNTYIDTISNTHIHKSTKHKQMWEQM